MRSIGLHRRRWWQGGALLLSGALTIALTQNTTTAAFTGQTADTGNYVIAQADFCTAPGRVDTLPTAGYPAVDTGTYQAQPTTAFPTTTPLGTISTTGSIARTLIKFTLKPKPSGCVVDSAVLTLRVSSGTAGETL